MQKKSLLRTILAALLIIAALASLVYAILTAPRDGQDLLAFQEGALDWLNGVYSLNEGPVAGYPPFVIPVFAPFALISFAWLVLVWLLINLVVTAVTIFLTERIFGARWRLAQLVLLAAFFLAWAPFRVTLRVGQISLITTAVLLASLWSRRAGKRVLSGLLMALSLGKYTLSFPFFLYFLWKRNWKIVITGVIAIAVLTEVYALRLRLSLFSLFADYLHLIEKVQKSPVEGFMGTTEIKMLILGLTGGRENLTLVLVLIVCLAGLAAMVLVFRRSPASENIHFGIMSLFAMWTSYHRTYDAVLCILPAAVFMDFVIRKKFPRFGWAGLVCLGLFIVSIPGLLTDRLGISAVRLGSSPIGFVGLHLERILVFGLFWALLIFLWKADPGELNSQDSAPSRAWLLRDGREAGEKACGAD